MHVQRIIQIFQVTGQCGQLASYPGNSCCVDQLLQCHSLHNWYLPQMYRKFFIQALCTLQLYNLMNNKEEECLNSTIFSQLPIAILGRSQLSMEDFPSGHTGGLLKSLSCHQLNMNIRLEPNMLKIYLLFLLKLPKIFTHYSFFIPIVPPIIPFLFYCVNDNIIHNAAMAVFDLTEANSC